MVKFILLFTIIPLFELGLLIKLSQLYGFYFTLGLVITTGIGGGIATKTQKAAVLKQIKASIDRGEMPADELISGLLVLVGSIGLLTPGPLTDIIGLTCIFPASRAKIKVLTRQRFKNFITAGEFSFSPNNEEENKQVEIDYKE